MSSTFDRYIRNAVIRIRQEDKKRTAYADVERMTARQYRAHRRQLRRLWKSLPKELRR